MLVFRGVILIIVLALIWQLLTAMFKIPSYLLPSPLQIIDSLQTNFILLLRELKPTAIEIVSGLALGVLFGIAIALLMTICTSIRFWLLPLIIVSQAIPTFVFAPLLVLWFGYGLASKIMVVTLMLFFPVANSLYQGLQTTPIEWLDMAHIMAATKTRVMWHLRFPAALPQLAAGIKIATALAPIGAIVSEWVGASQGLGFLMLNANARLDTSLMFACLVIIVAFSLLLYGVVDHLLNGFISRRHYA